MGRRKARGGPEKKSRIIVLRMRCPLFIEKKRPAKRWGGDYLHRQIKIICGSRAFCDHFVAEQIKSYQISPRGGTIWQLAVRRLA